MYTLSNKVLKLFFGNVTPLTFTQAKWWHNENSTLISVKYSLVDT